MAMIYTDDQQPDDPGRWDSPGTPVASQPQPTYPTYAQPSANRGAPDIQFSGGFAPTAPSPAGQLNPSFAYPSGGGSNRWDEAFIRQNLSETGQDPNTYGYWLGKYDELDARGKELGDPGYALRRLRDVNSGGSPQAPAPAASYTGGNIFDDPATAPFMQLLTSRINALNQPYHNPQLDQLNGYLQQYFQKLQGPAYTPQQMDLLQTQSLDPLTRERDAALQREKERGAARGLGNSGVAQMRQNQIENQFEQLRTQSQAGFASKAVDLDRINQQQAAGVAQLLANIEQTAFNQNEQRSNQALDLAKMVPDLARQRMLDASGLVNQNSVNPASLLSLSMNADQADAARSQQLWLGLAQLVPGLLDLFKPKR